MYNITTDSNKDGVEVAFREFKMPITNPAFMIAYINDILPQYYIYDGYIATTYYTPGAHNPTSRLSGPAQVDFAVDREWWVTVYIRPFGSPGKHDWGFETNPFGRIYPKP